MDRTSEFEGHQLYESSVIQLPKLVTFNVTNFGTITLVGSVDFCRRIGARYAAGGKNRRGETRQNYRPLVLTASSWVLLSKAT